MTTEEANELLNRLAYNIQERTRHLEKADAHGEVVEIIQTQLRAHLAPKPEPEAGDGHP